MSIYKIIFTLLSGIFFSFSTVSFATENSGEVPYSNSTSTDSTNIDNISTDNTNTDSTSTDNTNTAPNNSDDNYYSEVLHEDEENTVHKVSYGRKVGQKAIRGVANMGLSFFEIPKNIIIINNESNFMFAMTAGVGLGILNTVLRSAVGVTDLAFFLLPTKPVVYPIHPWNNYLDVDTNYQGIFITDF